MGLTIVGGAMTGVVWVGITGLVSMSFTYHRLMVVAGIDYKCRERFNTEYMAKSILTLFYCPGNAPVLPSHFST